MAAFVVRDDKTAATGQSSGVARAVQDPNNHELTFIVHVVDGIIAREADPQAGRETGTCRCGKREMKQCSQSALILSMSRVAVASEASVAM